MATAPAFVARSSKGTRTHRVIRFGRLLSLALWVGGLVFFAFVVAPVAFSRLPSAHEAGLIVGATLRVLHLLGLACGALFLLLTLVDLRRIGSRRIVTAELVLDLVMLGVTAYLQFAILPAMEVARTAAGGDVALAAPADPARVHFDRLHLLSEKLEGVVLLCGVGLLFAMAGEEGPTSSTPVVKA
jgi:hypothetical protein